MKNPIKKSFFGLRAKLIYTFLLVAVIPLVLLTGIAWWQIFTQGHVLQKIAVRDATSALNARAVENLKRLSTDTATQVAEFLYNRDEDALYVANLAPSLENYSTYVEYSKKNIIDQGSWVLNPEGTAWIPTAPTVPPGSEVQSSNVENNDMSGFLHHPQNLYNYKNIPLYDEITFVDLKGQELIKVHPQSTLKVHYPLDPAKKDISQKENTYIKAENYFEQIKNLQPGEIYVSNIIGAHVKTNYIGMYLPEVVDRAAEKQGYEIEFAPEEQAYSSGENPVGRQFEGIIRWATPVVDKEGKKIGYVTLALNHDHLIWMVTHITPMDERSIEMPNALTGNYAYIWDYKSRNIAHPRHHSIAGYNPETGEPQIPWLEESIYKGWKDSSVEKWNDYIVDYPLFHEQSRSKKPAEELTRQGLVGLDGRYLNNAPQGKGWMDLTEDGGSGSFYILWEGLYKISATAAIPYYTGQYAPSEDNDYSKRGFGFVVIDSDLEFFTRPAQETGEKLETTIDENLGQAFIHLVATTLFLTIFVISIAIRTTSSLTSRITGLIEGISHFRAGERQFRFNSKVKDEFGTLADSFDDMADGIVASVKSALCILDMNKKFIYLNERALEMLNKTLDQMVGQDYHKTSLYPYGTIYSPMTALDKNREAAISYLPESKRYVKPEARIITDSKGQAVAYIIESHDITEMVTRQMALEEAILVANQANAHKGDFLARMSHEIRTPMNAIIGLSQILRKYLDTISMADNTAELDEAQSHVRQVETSSQHLLGLLNDILDVSKIEAGKITFSREIFELQDLIKTVSSIIKPRCDEKNISFNIFYDDFNIHAFLSDPLRLRQVLINLLANAVKFTPELGTVTFRIQKLERKDDQTKVSFSISDTGIGISPEDLNNIFKPFEQATSNISHQYGGTGLGLTISRHIVDIFGGDILVKSTPGEGSEFEFSIWLDETTSSPKVETKDIADPANKLIGKRALLVDDVDLNRLVARAMMKITGITIDEAHDGQMALDIFKDSPQYTYDIILMDVRMPRLDGHQATQAIRALDRPDAATVPIIALTANAFTEDLNKAIQSGMNDHLAKPVSLDALMGILFRFI